MTGRTDRASCHAAAPPEAVWAVLTDPALVPGWLPPDGMSAHIEAWEARPGGALRVVLTYRDAAGAPGKSTADSDVAAGRFLAADPPRHLAWATRFEGVGPGFEGEMTMAWTLVPDGAGTRIEVEAGNVPDGISAEDHAAGLGATLRQLARAAAALRR